MRNALESTDGTARDRVRAQDLRRVAGKADGTRLRLGEHEVIPSLSLSWHVTLTVLGHGLQGMWLKDGHEITMYAPPDLAPLPNVDLRNKDTSPSDHDGYVRRAFTVACLRGALVGSTREVYDKIPSAGWKNSADFFQWLGEPEVAALHARCD